MFLTEWGVSGVSIYSAIAAGAAWGASAGGAAAIAVPVVGTTAAPATTAAGATVGVAASYTTRRFTVALNRALERSSRRDSSISYRKVQKSGPNLKEAERKGTDGYKLGKYWDQLHSSGSKIEGVTPKKQNKMYGVLSEAKRKFGGEIKMDENGTLYKFDTGHKNGKIHLERIEKKADGFYGTGEVDPETGRVLKILKRKL